ncbi:MAG: L,D-transpeptidase family protein [Sphingomonadales bacterium]
MTGSIRRIFFFVALVLVGGGSVQAAAIINDNEAVASQIQEAVEQAHDTGQLSVLGREIAGIRLIPAFYTDRRFTPAWTDEENINDLYQAIFRADQDGLDPNDFHLPVISLLLEAATETPLDAEAGASLDILLTDSLARLVYQLYYGKVDPVSLDGNWNLKRKLFDSDPVGLLEQTLAGHEVGQLLEKMQSTLPSYTRLREELARYREIAAQGGWPVVPGGPSLKPGMTDPRVIVLRDRLGVSGGANADFFDSSLEQAVKDFQTRHGLDSDGVVGPATLRDLNKSVAERVDQIRVNMERLRWVSSERADLAGEFIIANIAGFTAYYFRDWKIAWQTKAMVGKPYRQSPVFTALLSYVVINPTWTVPSGIKRRSIIPNAKKDPNYLNQNHFDLFDVNGKLVDPVSIDWENVNPRNFPYRVVQRPGEDNALGRVKFIFPNGFSVYLHDTPHRELFGETSRAFSSGCIRIENPFDLAEILLSDQPQWSRENIDAVYAAGTTRTIHLSRKIPVYLLYLTAVQNFTDGELLFFPDVYNRDAAVLEALDTPFSAAKPFSDGAS